MEATTLLRLHAAVEAVCPIVGVGGSPGSVTIEYKSTATAAQKTAAANVVSSFDYSKAADDAWDPIPERKDLKDNATQAIADNDAFLAIASPTTAQTLAQVKKLTQQNTRIIKALRKAL